MFHAIELKHFEIVKCLIVAGSNTDHHNYNGDTPKLWALANGFDRIEELIPTVEEYFVPDEYVGYHKLADHIPTVLQSDQPPFFPDVFNMLRSMESDAYFKNFLESKVSLMEFLTLTDKRLIEIGIPLPVARNRILYGIHKFHQHKWSPLTVPLQGKQNSMVDVLSLVSGYLKQILVVRSALIFTMRNNFKRDANTTQLLQKILAQFDAILLKLPALENQFLKVSLL